MRGILSLSLATVVVLSGCAKKSPDVNVITPPPGGKTFSIGYSQSTLQDPWRKAMNSALDEEIKLHPEAKVLKQDAQNDAATQITQVQNLETQGMDALMISPIESGPLTPIVKQVFQKGIPVILLDRGIDSEDYTTLVGGDNTLIGKRAGDYVVRTHPEGAKIIELAGILDATATKERAKGFRQALEANKDKYPVIASQEAKYLRPDAITVMQSLLQAHPDVDVVYAHNDEMALGAVKVLKDSGKLADVAVVGVDGQNEAIDAVAKGEMAATYVYPRPAADGLKAALDILNGKQVPKRITLDTTEITKENAKDYVGKGF